MGSAPHTTRFGEFLIDFADRRLFGLQGEIHLGGRAFDVLETLLAAGGRLVTKDHLFETVWGGRAVGDAALTSVIHEIRVALASDGRVDPIKVVYGKGYRLVTGPESGDGRIAPSTNSSIAPSDRSGLATPTLAVLPFDDLSPAGDLRFFSDGISEEILSTLARGTDIRMVGKIASFAFRGDGKTRAQFELPATHILDGSVRHADGRVRITAHLLDVADRMTVWSETYEHGVEHLLDTQLAIATIVASRLETAFHQKHRSEVPPEIYELYLRAKEMGHSTAHLQLRLALLERVTKVAADFAPGWGALAVALGYYLMTQPLSDWGYISEEAKHAIRRALTLDRHEPDALTAELKLLEPYGTFEEQLSVLAKIESEIANTPDYRDMWAMHLAKTGRLEGSLDALVAAREQDGGMPHHEDFYSRCLYCSGRLQEARDALWGDLQAEPENNFIAATLLICAARLGDRGLISRLTDPDRLKRYPLAQTRLWSHIARIEIDSDHLAKRQLGETILAGFEASGRFDLTSAVLLASYLSASKCHDTIANLPIGPTANSPADSDYNSNSTVVLFVTEFPEIRQDRRFAMLCARLGLAQYWSQHDVWPDCADDKGLDYDFRSEIRAAAGCVPVDPPLVARSWSDRIVARPAAFRMTR